MYINYHFSATFPLIYGVLFYLRCVFFVVYYKKEFIETYIIANIS